MVRKEPGHACKKHWWSRERNLTEEEVEENNCKECENHRRFNWILPTKKSKCKDFDLDP